jgi:hypothetical protein
MKKTIKADKNAVKIKLGALCPKITEQIQGLDPMFDRINDSIIFLFLHGIITETEKHRANVRMVRLIERTPIKE